MQIARKPLRWAYEQESLDYSNLKKCFGEDYRTVIAEQLASLN